MSRKHGSRRRHDDDRQRAAAASKVHPVPAPRPRRRGLIAAVVVVALLVGAVGIAAVAWWIRPPAPAAIRRAPDQNVLLITLDTLRADALSCYGGRAATPTLDRLASLGTRYDFAHAHAVMTLPSHASVLTGLFPVQHGIHDNAGFRLPPNVPTLATLLHPHGMATAAFIASFALDSRFGLNSGFDVYDERYGKSRMTAGFSMPERRGDAVVAAAVSWISQQRGRWFAWAHLFDPHAPYEPPSPYKEQYADQPYFGEVAYTDSTLGRLLDAARDQSGRPTLVIVTGDHGEGLGDHGELTHGLFAYEPTLRIPLIVAQIDRATPAWSAAGTVTANGSVSQTPVRHVDIVPTILDTLQLPIPSGLPGRSLLAGDTDPGARPSYFEAMSASLNRGWAPLTGVLTGREKYIDLPMPERYDLSRDPGEQTNVASQDAGRARQLEARLREFGQATASSRQQEDPQARARLRALGYVSGNAAPKARYSEEDDPKRLVDLDRLLRRGVELYEQKRPREAIPVYREVIAERPAMEVTYDQLAMLYWDLGDPGAAIGTLERARQAGADSVAVRTRLGTYLAEADRVSEALPLLQEAASGAFPDLEALNALGIALVKSGRVNEGTATFARILELNPSNTSALENLGAVSLQRGEMNAARRYLERSLALDPASPQAHNSMGVIEMKAGNRKAAIEHWKQAVAGDPSNFDALYNLATELVNDGQRDAARPFLDQFVRTAPPAFYQKDIEYVRRLVNR
jgi:arylsulfatase A-like enzyme/Flp pilus assembly protein TadD